MVIKPKIRGFLCATAHPVGCKWHVKEQIDYVKAQAMEVGPKRVLVIGGSTGYGLATRIAATFGNGAATLNISFEKAPTETKTASPGWYNTAAFEEYAKAEGYMARSIFGDAFSLEMKEKAIEVIKETMGQVDMVIYSVAAPRRTTHEGVVYRSVLKPLFAAYKNKSVNLSTNELEEVIIEPATDEEAYGTEKVMGGEDWKIWIEMLHTAGVLANGATTMAYSYIGPALTHAIYRAGTIGKAKDHLEQTAHELNAYLKVIQGQAYVSVNKALVTQASAAIPVIPLYMTILTRLLLEQDKEEGCIEQICRLFIDKLYNHPPIVDEGGRLRVDDYEMDNQIQAEVEAIWEKINADNLSDYADMSTYWQAFYKLFGFGITGIDYDADVDVNIKIDDAIILG